MGGYYCGKLGITAYPRPLVKTSEIVSLVVYTQKTSTVQQYCGGLCFYRSLNLSAHSFEMDKANISIVISTQRAIIAIIIVGRN